MIQELRPEHPYFDGPLWQQAVAAAGGWSEPREITVTTSRPASPERMVDYLGSMSWVAAMAEDRRREMLARIDALISGGETPAQLPIHVVVGLTSLA